MSQSSGPTANPNNNTSSITPTSGNFFHQSLTPPPQQTTPSSYHSADFNMEQGNLLALDKTVEFDTDIFNQNQPNNIRMSSEPNQKLLTSSPSSLHLLNCQHQGNPDSPSNHPSFNTASTNNTRLFTMPAERQATSAKHQLGTVTPPPECNGCMQAIHERYYLLVMDQAWHLYCLRCFDCKQSLDNQKSCFAKDGVIYCKDDYFKRFPRKCNGCSLEIRPNELIMRARNSVFHIHCFKCLACEKQLNIGDEYGIGKDNVSIFCRQHYGFDMEQQQQMFGNHSEQNSNNNQYTGQFGADFNRPYCSTDQAFPSIYQPSDQNTHNSSNYNSYLCNLPPTPGISPPSSFHSQHLSLNSLMSPNSILRQQQQQGGLNDTPQSTPNQNSTTLTPNSGANSQLKGRPKKRKANNNNNDAANQSNKKLSKAKQTNSNSSSATTGGSSAAKNNSVDLNNLSSSKQMSSSAGSLGIGSSPPNQSGQSTNLDSSGLLGSVDSPDDYNKQFDSNLDYFSDDDEDDLLDTSSNGANDSGGTNCHLLNSAQSGYYDSVAAVAAAAAAAQRQKRMRTSFKHHQLRVMKSYFELNHNPDAKDLKQLSQKTGLSKRVLQVWFQNARAKFRRGQGGPDCPQSQQSPNPNGSLNISSSGNLNNSAQGVSSSSSLSSNSSSLSSNSSTSSTSSDLNTNSSLQMLKQQQQQINNSNPNLLHLNLEMIDESSNNDSGFGTSSNYTLLGSQGPPTNNTNHNQSNNPNFTSLNPVNNSQGHIQLHSQSSYQHHMLQQPHGANNDFIGDNLIIS